MTIGNVASQTYRGTAEGAARKKYVENNGKDATDENSLGNFYDFIQDRIKNGEPKYAIGASEMSIGDWKKLMDRVDKDIDTIQAEQEERIEKQKQDEIAKTIHNTEGAPYSALAKDGLIDYNGVVFVCDDKNKALCLGDMSNSDNVLSIPLSGGGCLKVNRDNLGDLSKAIGMFSPGDINLIMRAIAQDTKAKQMEKEIEDTISKIL